MNGKHIFQSWWMALVGMVLLFSSCQENDLLVTDTMPEIPEGYVAVSFKAQILDMTEVQTRAVDPDGLDIHNMKLFCFNTYGLFITVAYAELSEQNHTNLTGQYKAVIPSETEVIHFIANQNIGQYELADFAGKSEAEVLSAMEGGSGMMIYWGRFKKNGTTPDIVTQLSTLNENKGIILIRNQAKVTVEVVTTDGETAPFIKSGFRTTNIHAYGTVAPYCSEHGFEISTWPNDHVSVTLPANKAKLSDIVGVNTAEADYIFEHENTLDDPVSVIIRGKNASAAENADDLYYRVLLLDIKGNPLKILRNHHYQIKIKGELSYGQPTFDEALTAPATNNVWIAVDDWVNEISDGTSSLGVEETHIVLDALEWAGKAYTFSYNATDQPEISWVDGNNVAKQNFTSTYDSSTDKGTITVDLLAMASSLNQQSGTLLLEMGQMYRKVNITVVKNMNFTPSWVSSNVYMDAGENITLKFTIPDDCPEGLFPFPVMVSVNDLDVRAASGMTLPVRTKGEVDWYGDDNGLGYKYEYMIEEPGVHRLYFSSVLPHSVGDTEEITLEAEFFSTLTKKVNFTDTKYRITLPVYDATDQAWGFQQYWGGDNKESEHQDDEYIYYLLVPQKKGAEVKFTINLEEKGETTTAKNANANDEFFLFSKTLDLENGTGYTNGGVIDVSSSSTSASNGRTILFYPTDGNTSSFTIQTKTNKARSEDVVRISSNNNTSYSAKNQSSVLYTGDEYRSAIFELGNYRPFGFEAQVGYDNQTIGTWGTGSSYGDDNHSTHVEPVDTVKLTYKPNQNVTISFDVKSFAGSDKKTVSPFGNAFKIYIDAPMLVLSEKGNLPIEGDKDNPGHFIYTVPADGTSGRVSIPFKKNTICSTGEITLSTDEEEIVFYKKTFKVLNQLITGTIKYKNGETDIDVPKDAFVAFIRSATNSRIGVMTITKSGEYSLNLRSEYVFEWDDKIELDYKVGENVYECKGDNFTLEYLFEHPNVVLTKAVENIEGNS